MTAINILYHQGSGSQGIDLAQEMPDSKYQATKRTAILYMKANHAAPGAIELLEQFPFSLWQATNDFGDDFEVLYMNASMELYVEIENGIGIWRRRIDDGIPEIVRAFEIAGHHLRFVAVQLDDTEAVENVAPPMQVRLVRAAFLFEQFRDARSGSTARVNAQYADAEGVHFIAQAVCDRSKGMLRGGKLSSGGGGTESRGGINEHDLASVFAQQGQHGLDQGVVPADV